MGRTRHRRETADQTINFILSTLNTYIANSIANILNSLGILAFLGMWEIISNCSR